MGKIRKFVIELNNATGAYYAGQSVSGKVVLELTETIKLKALKIHFHGECAVSFVEQAKKKSVNDREIYFDQIDVLYGNASGQTTAELPAGNFEYPFVFTAPTHLPSSFEHENGSVRYFAKAELVMPLLTRNRTVKRPFTIVALADLQREPTSFQSVARQAHRNTNNGLLSCTSGGIDLQLHLQRGAFVPGENITIFAEIANASSRRVKQTEAWLQQNIILSTRHGARRFIKGERKLTHIKHDAIKTRSTQVWEYENMQIPPLPPTNLGKCKYIEVQYLLNFVVSIDGAADIQLSAPIFLGTIPLYNQPPEAWNQNKPKETTAIATAKLSSSSTSKLPIAQSSFNDGAGPSSSASNLPAFTSQPSAPPLSEYMGPPPAYSECQFMNAAPVNDSQEMQAEDLGDAANATYRPLYPMYALTSMQRGL